MNFQFDHVAQQVPDISAAVRWYQQPFPQTKVLYHDATWAFLDVDGVKIAFVLQEEHPGHLAWRVSDEDLERLATTHQQTIKPHRDGTRSFYLKAPGGQSIEIIAYPRATES